MAFLDLEFAPLHIPLERRLQTLAVVTLLLSQLGVLILAPAIVYFLIFYTRFWWLCIIYITWYLFLDGEAQVKGSKRSEWVRSWRAFVYMKNYYPLKLVKLPWGELDPRRNYLFCYFPHGMFSTGAVITFSTNAVGISEIFPSHKSYIHTLSLFLKLPFIRELMLRLGFVDASKPSIEYILSKPDGGNISALVIGGSEEALFCRPGVQKLVYKKRKGFVKLALKHGAPLVPVYGFGETDLYSQINVELSWLKLIRNVVKNLTGIICIMPKGRGIFQYSFGMLPHRRSVTLVVGEPVEVQKTENPTQEQIEELHQRFEQKVVELFESQKKYYIKDYENVHLEIT